MQTCLQQQQQQHQTKDIKLEERAIKFKTEYMKQNQPTISKLTMKMDGEKQSCCRGKDFS